MKGKKKEHKILKRVFAGVLIVLLLVVNIACFRLENILTLFLENPEIEDVETLQTANDNAERVTKEIEGEGIVLLKNEEKTLPLKSQKINVFGWGSVSPIYVGSGSGGGNAADNITVQKGLENAGFTVNDELTDFYESLDYERVNAGPLTGFQPDLHLYEADREQYTDKMLENARTFSDTAVVVIARPGGEASDLVTDMETLDGDEGRHILEITSKEENLLKMVKENFDNVIVLVNAANAMELGFLEDEGVDAALWIGNPGKTGFESVARVLNGEINPSGALVDTFAYDAMSAPSFANFGDFRYSDGEDAYYVDYAEGIYVGYRYYETRYVDNNTGKCDEETYHKAVQYPFGYGLSYTEFEQKITDFKADDKNISMEVEVTNVGDVEGKDIVQVYYTAPYTEGGIEKSHVVLAAFDKTELLEAGETEKVTLEIPIEEMASYDYINQKAYVLEKGNYEIKLMDNAHEMIESRNYEVTETIVYDGTHARSTDQIAATNVFDEVAGDVTYVSRADWEGTLPQEVARERTAGEEILEQIQSTEFEVDSTDADIVIADHGIEWKEMKGLEYEDEKWDKLLEQLSVKDMKRLIGMGGYKTSAIKSINKGATSDVDGPAGINAIVNGESGVSHATEVVLASTWNCDLAYAMGESLALEADAYAIDGIYAPAMNIHRSPFGGRNFEYYSEDAYLSGEMAETEVSAIRDKGKYCYLKHFVMNDQETNRAGVAVWANEQSMREIYLKPFEMAVKEGGATAMMSAFNRLGTTWCGADERLLQTVLRDEWGFRGMVITDYDGAAYMNVDQAIRAGNDLMLSTTGDMPTDTSNTSKQAMREASHNILYTVVNSDAAEYTYEYKMPVWMKILLIVDGVALVSVIGIMYYKNKKKKNA